MSQNDAGEQVVEAAAKPLLIIVGPSQSGKSTLVGILTPTGETQPLVGNGGGSSVTTEPKVFRTIIDYHVLDCPGWDDSKLRFTGEACGIKVFEALFNFQKFKEGVNRKCIFLIVNSLTNDSNQLAATSAWLRVAFGEAAPAASVVLATKADILDYMCNNDERMNREAEYRRSVQECLGHDRLLFWQSRNGHTKLQPDSPIMVQQLQALQQSLGNVEAVPIEQLEELQKRINKKAEELCSNQQPLIHTQEVTHKGADVVEEKKTVGDASTLLGTAGAVGGATIGGAVEYGSAATLAVKTAACASAWLGYAVPPAAVAMGPVTAAAAGGAVTVGALCWVAGRWIPVQEIKSRVVPWERVEKVQTQVFRPVADFMAEATKSISEEIRASLQKKNNSCSDTDTNANTKVRAKL